MASPAARATALAAAGIIAAAAGIAAYWEGRVPVTHLDPIGIPSFCYGTTKGATPGRVAREGECEALLIGDLATRYAELRQCIRAELPPHTWAALLSWAYNVGTAAACGSTLARMANAGATPAELCPQLDRWNQAGGRVLPGLAKRRAHERAVCEGRESQ